MTGQCKKFVLSYGKSCTCKASGTWILKCGFADIQYKKYQAMVMVGDGQDLKWWPLRRRAGPTTPYSDHAPHDSSV